MSKGPATFDLDLKLADIGFHVVVDSGDDRSFVDARFGAYRGDAPEPIALHVRRDESVVIPQPVGTEWPGSLGSLDTAGVVRFERVGERLIFDPARRSAHAIVAHPRSTGLKPVEDPTAIDTPLRLLLSYLLPRVDGMLLHASGYGDDRGAVVFAAASGGGKTTTANKLPPEHVLSDDQVAIRQRDGGWDAFALPFVGLYARATIPRRVPLRALVLLARGEAPRVERVGAALAVARVLACSPYFVRNDPAAARLLDLAGSLVRAVPVYRLETTRDAPVMPWVEQLLRA